MDGTGTPCPKFDALVKRLRPYQTDLIARIGAAIAAGRRRILLALATGGGKTVVAAALAAEAIRQGKRVLFLVHRRELIHQSSRKLHDAGIDHGIVAAGFPSRPGALAQVASISTLHHRAVRSRTIPMPDAELLLVDEAHHASSRSWTRIIETYPGAVVVGLTATPCRADGRGLGGLFECLVEGPSIRQLIADDFLVPTRVFAPTRPDLEGIRTVGGDFDEGQLAERFDTPVLVGDVISHWLRLAERRRTAVFAISRAHAVHLRDEFSRQGVVACYIDGDTPMQERDTILDHLGKGIVEVVVNVGVLTEGWDQPEVQCVVLARPTKSFGLYRQIVGRGLRPAPGKSHLLVIDHAGASHMHGLVEDDVAWELSDRKRAQAVPTTRGAAVQRKLVDCPECDAVFWQGQPCPSCGWRARVKPEPVDVLDGDLELLDRDGRRTPHQIDRREFYGQLLGYADAHGYRRGWAFHKFIEKFHGDKPLWSWRNDEALDPTAEVNAWVQSRIIAWRKARAKAGGAWQPR